MRFKAPTPKALTDRIAGWVEFNQALIIAGNEYGRRKGARKCSFSGAELTLGFYMRMPTPLRALCVFIAYIGVSVADTDKNDPFYKVDKMRAELNGSCSYGATKAHEEDQQFMCQMKVLKNRCNEIDDCYVYCLSNDVGENIGGGCAHLCNYANKNP